ncbi:GLPGLI family protein [Mucilaginibacter boryungensis]|uniref:GLPGLI family protein n=1 Tax=Mucilaginibacter boryungensis TaxID=768480 RepID=A0ABR9XEH2_9SPHI|nr:GLPGLI family protein [Mucilaginibacter boryungensis]MBE9665587.1 GLPGLI family protein [Mucilaginibacter boryungensis]
MKNLLAIIITVCCFQTFAQKPDVALGKAVYDFTHVRDTLKRNYPYKERLTLLVGRNASVYKSLDKQLAQEQMIADVKNQVKNASNPNALSLTLKGAPPTQNEEYYQYINEKKLYTEENLVNYYLIEEPLPEIKWTIRKDTLSFSGLHCQMATAHFKGRDYTAWFCPDLPFHCGPWKLNGLPGLILEASDSKKEVVFKFSGFEDISASNITIAPPADDIKTTPTAMERLREARKADPAGFAKASHGSGQAKRGSNGLDMVDPSKIASINVKGYDGPLTKVINNPIELPEKK